MLFGGLGLIGDNVEFEVVAESVTMDVLYNGLSGIREDLFVINTESVNLLFGLVLAQGSLESVGRSTVSDSGSLQ